MNDRFMFRLPFYNNNSEFSHFEFILIGESLPVYNAGVMFHRGEYEQCTGLKDKNGNLIYEGDRIFDGDYFWQVKWDNYNAQWILSDPEGYETLTEPDAKYLEIIGNIHEQKDK